MRISKDTQRLDWTLISIVLVLTGIGVTMVYSATVNDPVAWYKSFWFRQILHFAVGWVLALGIVFTKPRFWYNMAYPVYILTVLMLIFVLFIGGTESHGAGRWIGLGAFHIQPSEFAKIGYLLALARFLSGTQVRLDKPTSFIIPGMLFIVPFILVLKQPNLSTALVFSATTLVAFYWSGLRLIDIFLLLSPVFSLIAAMNQLAWGLLIGVVALGLWIRKLPLHIVMLLMLLNFGGGFGSYLVWNSILEEHQRSRILTFVDPMRDPKGAGYQVIQSEVTIGSGGLFGKGFGEGSQTNLAFLPEEHTDFIFSVLSEQFGLVGGVIVLLIFYLLILRGVNICQLHSNGFVNIMAVGSVTILVFHIVVNVAMTVGMMPVTGLPLPFLSYGGSFVITVMMIVGFLLLLRIKGDEM